MAEALTDKQIEEVIRKLKNQGWEERMANSGSVWIKRAYAKAAGKAAAELGFTFDIEQSFAIDKIAEITKKFSKTTITTGLDEVKQVLAQGQSEGWSIAQSQKAMEQMYDSQWAVRADMIARTEMMRSGNLGQLEAWKQSGVVSKSIWQCAEDPCEICESLCGETVGLGEPFVELGQEVPMIGPDGEPILDSDGEPKFFENDYMDCEAPPLHVNCTPNPLTLISTPKGLKPIMEIKVGDEVITHKGHPRKVTTTFKRKLDYDDPPLIIKISTWYNSVELTSEHPILTSGEKWINVGELKLTNDLPAYVIGEDKYPKHSNILGLEVCPITEDQYLYNLEVEEDESYIANGFIVHNCRCTILAEIG
jgi:hypothetical protein